jgi:hypothetical protein
LVQGDTLFLNSKYAEYSGNAKKAFASGEAFMSSARLATDTINFDRNTQEVYYKHKRHNYKDNTLISKSGRYYVSQKNFSS